MKCLESSVKAKKTTYIKIVVSSKTQLNEFEELTNQIFNVSLKMILMDLSFNLLMVFLNHHWIFY